jgi:hypothetical protein
MDKTDVSQDIPENTETYKNTEIARNNRLKLLLFLTVCAIIPQYLIRGSMKACEFFYYKFSTYFGDLWYCYSTYLTKGQAYPSEYITGMQLIFRVLYPLKNLWSTYERYMITMTLLLTVFAVFTTYFLYLLVKKNHGNTKRIILFWIFAPSFLFFGTINFEFITIFTIILSYYLFREEEYYLSASVLAIGTTFKVFPVFLAPLFFFQAPKRYRLGSVLVFIITWISFNISFMMTDWNSWVFPYVWQIQNNVSSSPSYGTYWWIFYRLFEALGIASHLGKFSLLVFGGLYYYFMKKYWHLPLPRKCVIVMFIFILTDRVFSPQYVMYLLPFFALTDYDIDRKYFYTAEVLNVSQTFFLFALQKSIPLVQTMLFIKYFALFMLLRQTLQEPITVDTISDTVPKKEEIVLESDKTPAEVYSG